jgi:hypothetical protein
MEEILKNSNKVIIDKAVSAQGGGVTPYLPLPSLPGFTPPAAAAPAAPGAK